MGRISEEIKGAAYVAELGLDEEAKKAWSQNLGHEKMDTSVNYYGPVSVDRQKMRMLALHDKSASNSLPKTREELVALIKAAMKPEIA